MPVAARSGDFSCIAPAGGERVPEKQVDWSAFFRYFRDDGFTTLRSASRIFVNYYLINAFLLLVLKGFSV